MDIIIEYNSHRITLQVNPENIQINRPSSAQKTNIIGIGQVAIPQEPDLASFSIKSFFWKYLFDKNKLKRLAKTLAESALEIGARIITGDTSSNNYSFGITNDDDYFTSVWNYIDWIEAWQANAEPARITIVSAPNEQKQHFDYFVTCEQFNYEKRAGEEDDYYYELELLEYRHYGAEELTVKENRDSGGSNGGNNKATGEKSSKSRLNTSEKTPVEIEVKTNENIWSITERYGSGGENEWTLLYNTAKNKEKIANNLNDLKGQVLQLPKEWL